MRDDETESECDEHMHLALPRYTKYSTTKDPPLHVSSDLSKLPKRDLNAISKRCYSIIVAFFRTASGIFIFNISLVVLFITKYGFSTFSIGMF